MSAGSTRIRDEPRALSRKTLIETEDLMACTLVWLFAGGLKRNEAPEFQPFRLEFIRSVTETCDKT
jgi:hypothetical protein